MTCPSRERNIHPPPTCQPTLHPTTISSPDSSHATCSTMAIATRCSQMVSSNTKDVVNDLLQVCAPVFVLRSVTCDNHVIPYILLLLQ